MSKSNYLIGIFLINIILKSKSMISLSSRQVQTSSILWFTIVDFENFSSNPQTNFPEISIARACLCQVLCSQDQHF